MISRLIWKAINLHIKVTSYLGHFPIQWDKKSRRFRYISDVKKCFWWYFSIIGILLIQCVGVSTFILIREILYSDSIKDIKGFAFLQIILMIMLDLCGAVGVFLGVITLTFGKDNVALVNSIFLMESRLQKRKFYK